MGKSGRTPSIHPQVSDQSVVDMKYATVVHVRVPLPVLLHGEVIYPIGMICDGELPTHAVRPTLTIGDTDFTGRVFRIGAVADTERCGAILSELEAPVLAFVATSRRGAERRSLRSDHVGTVHRIGH